ncbi:MAG: hypothetical protein IKO49_02150 [Bacilli bacterium]|nr:hypothetical protein [Clostridia bacterium]MBR4618083.1 hypothetical protein [Bacilli bacterium]
MKIIGDPKLSDKFYIIKSDKSIEWVPSLETAKSYVDDKNNRNWFGKDIYCTNEKIYKGYNGKNYLKIDLPEKPKKIIKNENFKLLQTQIYEYLPKILNDLVKQENFSSLLEILSWSNSKVLKFKQLAKKFLTYRDSIYLYADTFLKNYEEKNENMDELQDIQTTYQEFLKDFPKFE